MTAAPKVGKFETANGRWAGVGPYYAMFPSRFSDRVVAQYSRPGQVVIDPFAGRGTAIFSAATQDRLGVGVEVNPVGWVYSKTKLSPATLSDVLLRLEQVAVRSRKYREDASELPRFFRQCFYRSVREFLTCARGELDWRRSKVDRTLMAFLLVYLHGKHGQALSNQMRQTKSMAPRYAMRWWSDRQLRAPRIDPVEFLSSRIEWRYQHGIPEIRSSNRSYFGSSTNLLRRIRHEVPRRASLLLTSPPYFRVTNYHYDQWLRLWLLGESPNALRKPGKHRAKFENRVNYERLLVQVFENASYILSDNAVVYVRTGRQLDTYRPTRASLQQAFPKHHIARRVRPFRRPTQTSLFGDRGIKAGEVDLVLTRR